MLVTKRDGEYQELDLNKIYAILEWACNGSKDSSISKIENVSISEIEMKAHLHFYDKIPTSQIHECLVKASADLISEEYPNYDWVAARLRWFEVRKVVFGKNVPPHIYEPIVQNINRGLYDKELLNMYTKEEWDIINSFVDHSRDDLFRYAGAQQMVKKYLLQNRQTKQIYETFQFPYILIAAILFNKYPKETRLEYVKRYYDQISQHYISLPTPVMAGLRTKVKQFSSCTVIESDDSLKSITASATAIVEYASRKAGIGLNIGRIRAAGQPVRGGDAVTTGVLPFAKFFAAALKSCSQGGVRGASATFNYPVWHLEFESLIELKNNKGTDETRLRTVDYCIHLNKTMYERLVQDSHITFFSPDEVPDLYEAFYGDPQIFKELYEKYEKDDTKVKKVIPAKRVFSKIMQERFDTGRIYILNADHSNTHSSFYDSIKLTNLCAEITLPTMPLGNENARIALCTLSALNWGKIETEEQMKEACELSVRALDEILDYQEYPNIAAELGVKEYRPLGIGIIGFAHYLAKNGLSWGYEATLNFVEKTMESMAYYLTLTSLNLAKEKGSCEKRTKYHDGILPIDTCTGKSNTTKDWESLRIDLKKYGIRNATLMALMPSETSSVLSNETNGIEPPKALITIKGSKDGITAQVVPEIQKLRKKYEASWDVKVSDYLKTMGILQKYIDQAISSNTSYNPKKQETKMTILLQDLLLSYKLGLKTLYYNNTYDGAGEDIPEEDCEGGACKI